MHLLPDNAPCLGIASDAQADTSPTGGFIAQVNGKKVASFCKFQSILPTWGFTGEGPHYCIAERERSMVIVTIWTLRHLVKGRRILWLLDSTVSLHALIKCTSTNPNVARSVEAFRIFCYFFHVEVWFEYVSSKSNYADGISRDLRVGQLLPQT